MSKISDRIIRSRGEQTQREKDASAPSSNDDERYEAFTLDTFPRMGFSVFCRGGKRHVFFYHNLDNLDLVERGEDGAVHFVRFTHRGIGVSMRGHDLHGLVEGVISHNLQAVYEYDETCWPAVPDGERIIDRIAVDALPNTMPARVKNDDAP